MAGRGEGVSCGSGGFCWLDYQLVSGAAALGSVLTLVRTLIWTPVWTLWLGGTCAAVAVGVADFAGSLVGAACGSLFQFVGLFRVLELHEVGYVEEGVALETEVYKSGLHAGQDAGDAPVVNGPCKGVLVFAFVVDFRELIVFKNCKPRLMRRAGNTNLFCHRTLPSGGLWLPVHAARRDGDAQGRRGKGGAEDLVYANVAALREV